MSQMLPEDVADAILEPGQSLLIASNWYAQDGLDYLCNSAMGATPAKDFEGTDRQNGGVQHRLTCPTQSFASVTMRPERMANNRAGTGLWVAEKSLISQEARQVCETASKSGSGRAGVTEARGSRGAVSSVDMTARGSSTRSCGHPTGGAENASSSRGAEDTASPYALHCINWADSQEGLATLASPSNGMADRRHLLRAS